MTPPILPMSTTSSSGPADWNEICGRTRSSASLGRNDVLFIDEIHGLPQAVAESFYQAIDAYSLSLPVSLGRETRTVVLKLEPFTLIGATTEESLLPKPLHSRFETKERLDLYSAADLEQIALARGPALGVEVTR